MSNQQHYEHLWKKVGDWEHESPHFKTRDPQEETLNFIAWVKKEYRKGNNTGRAGQNKRRELRPSSSSALLPQSNADFSSLNVLDLGCGGGRHVIAFAKAGFRSYGIDFSQAAITLAKKDAKDKKLNVFLKKGNVLDLPYKKDFFDIVHDAGCLHHLTKAEWGAYLENLLRVLKPAGYYKLFCFDTNTKYLTGEKITPAQNWIDHNAHHTHFFADDEIAQLFEKDFRIIKRITEQRKGGMRSFSIWYMQKKEA